MSAGRHTLQLASILGGAESERSAPLTVDVGVASIVESFSLPSSDLSPKADALAPCVSNPISHACDHTRLVATGLHAVSVLTSIPDGRLLFVEGDAVVRIVEGGLVSEPALVLESPSARIVGLAVDPDFATRRSIFVAWTSVSRNGIELNVSRYRELHNALGEGAIVVAGLPFQEGLLAPLAIDGNGLLHVAAPSTPQAPAAILRFTRDGLVPRENPVLSPAIADGFARPSDMAIDGKTGRIWISGVDDKRPYSVATLTTIDTASGRGAPEPVLERVQANEAPMLAVLSGSTHDPTASLLVARGGQLLRSEITMGVAAKKPRRVPVEPEVSILSIAEGSSGSWYVLTGTEDGAQSLLQVAPR
jgi:hypothetical protein